MPTDTGGTHDAPELSFVVIGLNEADRLPRTFDSIRAATVRYGRASEILYVDSCSTDGSYEFACSQSDIRTLRLDSEARNAARARNLGICAAGGRFVQLLDGDMELDPDWIERALAELERAGVAAVTGRLDETGLSESLWNATFGHDWNCSPGPTDTLGGASLWKREDLVALGGFDTALDVGEDTDLAIRATTAGHRLQRLPIRMAGHDLGLCGAGDWWRRGVCVGRSHEGVSARHPTQRRLRGSGIRGECLLLGMSALSTGLVAARSGLGPIAVGLCFVMTWFVLQGCRTLRLVWRDRNSGLPWDEALMHSVHVLAVKVPVTWGRISHRLVVRQTRLAGASR